MHFLWNIAGIIKTQKYIDKATNFQVMNSICTSFIVCYFYMILTITKS